YPPHSVDEIQAEIQQSLGTSQDGPSLKALLNPALRVVLGIGLLVAILQQITGVNAIYFYATTIFEQSGVGKDAAFAQAVWVGLINVVFTLIAMALIDRLGRRPLLLIGVLGVAISMSLTAYGFHQATYQLSTDKLTQFEGTDIYSVLRTFDGQVFQDDLAFKSALKRALGEQMYQQHEGELISAAIHMNPILVLIGILGFVASFAVSLGPVMWVLLSELFPTHIRGIAISAVGFINSVVSFLVQLIFPWELAHFGNSVSYLLFAILAIIGLVILYFSLPETKGRSLEELEAELIGTETPAPKSLS
ncbi:MAG: MFS transporter, partial [Bacteroidota bacterium]